MVLLYCFLTCDFRKQGFLKIVTFVFRGLAAGNQLVIPSGFRICYSAFDISPQRCERLALASTRTISGIGIATSNREERSY